MVERYFVNGSLITKEEYLATGGMPVLSEPFVAHQWTWLIGSAYICERCRLNTTEVKMSTHCPGWPRMEIFEKIPEGSPEEAAESFSMGPFDPALTTNIRAEDVGGVAHYYINDQKVTRKEFMAAALSTGIWEEVQRAEKKNFGTVQNYMHNTLGLTRAHIEKLISEKVKEYSIDIIREYIVKAQPSSGSSNWFAVLIQKVVVDELQKSLDGNKLQTFVQDLLLKEVQKHVLSRMKVDIRVTSVNPEDGILREIVTPDVIREAREI